jgi:hypothetical protein
MPSISAFAGFPIPFAILSHDQKTGNANGHINMEKKWEKVNEALTSFQRMK